MNSLRNLSGLSVRPRDLRFPAGPASNRRADFETSGVAEPEYDFRVIPSFGPGSIC
jgi:hypothetical protein